MKPTRRKLFDTYRIEHNVRSSGSFDLAARSWVRYARNWKTELFKRSSIKSRWKAWRRRFEVDSYQIYQLDSNDSRNYVPDFPFELHVTKINGFFNPIVGNKLVLSNMLISFAVPCPSMVGEVIRGQPHTFPPRSEILENGNTHGTVQDDDLTKTLVAWTANHRKLVFRPHWSGGGQGVFFVERTDQTWYINGYQCPESDLLAIVQSLDRYLITAWVKQAAYANAIFPKTANTVRILTLRDAQGPYVAAAVHRFGSSRSFPVDTFHQGRGGISVDVDPTTGIMGKGLTADSNGMLQTLAQHPETGSPFEGVLIPHYAMMTQGLLRVCDFLPETLIVGWDVLITDDGYCVIEANTLPSLAVWQVHQPLLANPRNARFFHSHGIPVAQHLLSEAKQTHADA